jgi:hypothetical protein
MRYDYHRNLSVMVLVNNLTDPKNDGVRHTYSKEMVVTELSPSLEQFSILSQVRCNSPIQKSVLTCR